MIDDVLEEVDLDIVPSHSVRSVRACHNCKSSYETLVRENGAEQDIDSLIEDGIDEEADGPRDPR